MYKQKRQLGVFLANFFVILSLNDARGDWELAWGMRGCLLVINKFVVSPSESDESWLWAWIIENEGRKLPSVCLSEVSFFLSFFFCMYVCFLYGNKNYGDETGWTSKEVIAKEELQRVGVSSCMLMQLGVGDNHYSPTTDVPGNNVGEVDKLASRLCSFTMGTARKTQFSVKKELATKLTFVASFKLSLPPFPQIFNLGHMLQYLYYYRHSLERSCENITIEYSKIFNTIFWLAPNDLMFYL